MTSLRNVDRRLIAIAVLALGVEMWMMLSDVHLFWKPPGAAHSGVRVAKVKTVSHLAKSRSSLQLNWENLTPGQDLYEGDEIATMEQSTASLQFIDGQTVSLDPNSFLVLKSAGVSGNPTYQITLVQGGLQQTASPGGNGNGLSRLEIDVGGRKVITQGQSSFKIENSQQGQPRIAVDGGNVSVTDLNSQAIALHGTGNPLAQFSPGGVNPLTAELKPALLRFPVHDSVLTNPQAVSLRWRQLDAVGNQSLVEVSRDDQFRETILTRVVSDTQTDFIPDKKGHYFWRVTRLAGNRKMASVVATFEVRRNLEAPRLIRPKIERGAVQPTQPPGRNAPLEAPSLDRPIIHYQKETHRSAPVRPHRTFVLQLAALIDHWLVSSADAAEVLPNPPSNGKESRFTVELNWEAVPSATSYEIQIAADEQFAHIAADKVISGHASFSWHTDNPGFYYWRVAGIDPDGDHGPFSEFQTFRIAAAQNSKGDEASYDTFLQFDEYARFPQRVRVLYGPAFSHYYFSSSDPTSPPSVIYRKRTLANLELDYDYRLNTYYSLQMSGRFDRALIKAADFESRPAQATLDQLETVFSLGAERRFFQPGHYYAVQLGVRISYLQIPIQSQQLDDQLDLDSFGFFGPYAAFGYHQMLGPLWDAALKAGIQFQYSGDSNRFTQLASVELRRQVAVWAHAGFKFEESESAYRYSSLTSLFGSAHSLDFRPSLFFDFNY